MNLLSEFLGVERAVLLCKLKEPSDCSERQNRLDESVVEQNSVLECLEKSA